MVFFCCHLCIEGLEELKLMVNLPCVGTKLVHNMVSVTALDRAQ